MIRVSVDRSRCQGYANCVSASPDVFDVDDSGLAVVSPETIDEARLEEMRSAAVVCPVAAIDVTPA